VHAEPRVGGSLFRIANDLRFHRDRPPYKPYLDFAFWDGDSGSRSDPALITRISSEQVLLGVGVPTLTGTRLQRYRAALADPSRLTQLDTSVEALIEDGAELSEPPGPGSRPESIPPGQPHGTPSATASTSPAASPCPPR
jgi:uncharacterized protein (DUF2461 family)